EPQSEPFAAIACPGEDRPPTTRSASLVRVSVRSVIVRIVTNRGRRLAMQIGGVMRVRLITAEPDETAAEAIRRMLEAGVGSVVVCEDHVPVGIFTERDVLKLAGDGADFEAAVLRDVMTRNPLTISADDGILQAAQLMGERRLRHLPVVEGGNL